MKLVFIVIDQGESNRGLEYSLRYLSHRYNAIENKYKRGYFHEAHRFIENLNSLMSVGLYVVKHVYCENMSNSGH